MEVIFSFLFGALIGGAAVYVLIDQNVIKK